MSEIEEIVSTVKNNVHSYESTSLANDDVERLLNVIERINTTITEVPDVQRLITKHQTLMTKYNILQASHDDLLAACEKSLEIYDVIDGLLATDEEIEAVVEAMYRPIKTAYAKGKESK